MLQPDMMPMVGSGPVKTGHQDPGHPIMQEYLIEVTVQIIRDLQESKQIILILTDQLLLIK